MDVSRRTFIKTTLIDRSKRLHTGVQRLPRENREGIARHLRQKLKLLKR